MSCKIFVMTHKKYWMPTDDVYQPLLVGSALRKDFIGLESYQYDNIGASLSVKNKNYCELTGLYWVWKNTDYDVVGLVHYRRYFSLNARAKREAILSREQIEKLMEKTDLVLPRKRHYYIETVSSQYEHAHHKQDLICTRNIIQQVCPDYLSDYDAIMKERSLYLYNMFIAQKPLIDSYCSWLFSILEEVEKQLDISTYTDNDKRVFGFLSERLFNVWIHHQNITIKEIPLCNLENQHWAGKILNFVKRKMTKK